MIEQARLPNHGGRWPGWQSDLIYLPAGPVGGEHCDVFEYEGRLLFPVGDVSGKGVSASLLASHLHAKFRSLAEAGLSVGRMMEAANRIFWRSSPRRSLQRWCWMHRAERHSRACQRAGHVPVVHVRREALRLKPATARPLGLHEEARFPTQRLWVRPGEMLLICTDEACSPAQEEYGIERLQNIAQAWADATPARVLDACLEDLFGFVARAECLGDITCSR